MAACKDRSNLQDELRQARRRAEGFEVALGETTKQLDASQDSAKRQEAALKLLIDVREIASV